MTRSDKEYKIFLAKKIYEKILKSDREWWDNVGKYGYAIGKKAFKE